MAGLLWPTTGAITSPYGWRSGVNPLQTSDFHTGIDFGVPVGTPVYATHSGVFYTQQNYGGGTMVIGQGSGGYGTVYAHLSRSTVGTGKYVTAGSLIGYSGMSGAAVTGPHLHYEVKLNGKNIDPRYTQPQSMAHLPFNLSKYLPSGFQYDAATAALQQQSQLAQLQQAQAEQRRAEIERSRGILGEYRDIAVSQQSRSASRFGVEPTNRNPRLGRGSRPSRFAV